MKRILPLIFVVSNLLLACNRLVTTAQPIPITIAFPLENEPRTYAVERLLEMLQADSLIQGGKVAGMPSGKVTIALDLPKMQANGRLIADVKEAVQDKFDPLVPFKNGRDSLELILPGAFVLPELNGPELGSLQVKSPTMQYPVRLDEIAEIRIDKDLKAIVVDGKTCMVIRGTTPIKEGLFAEKLKVIASQLSLTYSLLWGK